MPKKSCAFGLKWDNLLQTCMPQDFGLRPPMPTEPFLTSLARLKNMPPADQTVVRLKNTPAADQKGAAFIPEVWIVVLLVTLASIVALIIWLVIYRRHKRQSTEVPAEHPVLKTDPPHCLPPSEACSTLLHTSTVWQEGVDAEIKSTEHEQRDWSGLKGSAVRQETVPLPATKLVTTKTL